MNGQGTLELPKKVGIANIDWSESTWRPERHDETVFMPTRDMKNVHLLLDGSQAIVEYSTEGPLKTIFFGTDEQVFVTGISRDALKVFRREGEKEFFKFLQPKIIKEMSPLVTVEPVRQGDIFALRIADTWDGAHECLVEQADMTFRKTKRVQNLLIFNTRHSFAGKICSVSKLIPRLPRKRSKKERMKGPVHPSMLQFYLASGIISAPDHEPLIVDNGVYIISRTTGLTNSTQVRLPGGD